MRPASQSRGAHLPPEAAYREPSREALARTTHQEPEASKFDPARDGFGFRNPVGLGPDRAGGALLRRFDSFLYGGGLCFGMAAAALENHVRPTSPYPLAAPPPTRELLEIVRRYHAWQLRPAVILAAVRDWVLARGGRPDGVLERLRLPGESSDRTCSTSVPR